MGIWHDVFNYYSAFVFSIFNINAMTC